MSNDSSIDLFSSLASGYAIHRPGYPEELFQYLSDITPENDLCWDCGTGNGQAAKGLSPYFEEIIATDLSKEQISHALEIYNVEYRVAKAESSNLEAESVDLINVSAALHWFDREAFYKEALRVLKPGGIIACYTYFDIDMGDGFNAILKEFDALILPYAHPNLEYAKLGYPLEKEIFCFKKIKNPPFQVELHWTMTELLGMFSTMSPVAGYLKATGINPIDLMKDKLLAKWGYSEVKRKITMPLSLLVGRKTDLMV